MTARCELSELPVEQCGCRLHPRGQAYEREQAEQRAEAEARYGPVDGADGDLESGPVLIARYAGRCPECKTNIIPGEQVRQGHRGWSHVACC